MSRSNSSSGTTMAIVTLLISAMVMLNNGNRVTASQRTIHLDTNGQYKGVVIGFSEDFEAETTSRPTIIKSIMASDPKTFCFFPLLPNLLFLLFPKGSNAKHFEHFATIDWSSIRRGNPGGSRELGTRSTSTWLVLRSESIFFSTRSGHHFYR